MRTYSDEVVELKVLNKNLERIAIALEKRDERSAVLDQTINDFFQMLKAMAGSIGLPIGTVVDDDQHKGHDA